MSKRLWTKTSLKNKVKQKQSWAKLSQAEPSWAKLSQAEPRCKVRKRFGKRFGQGKRELKGLIGKRRKKERKKERRNEKEGIRTRQGFGELIWNDTSYVKIYPIQNFSKQCYDNIKPG